MASPYTNLRTHRLPQWLGRDDAASYGRRFQAGVGGAQDAEDALLKATVKMRFAPMVPADAFFLAGADRLLERAPVEDEDAFRARLVNAPTLNKWIGTRPGIAAIFDPYGFNAEGGPAAHVLHNYEAGFDGNEVWFSRVFIVLDVGIFTTDGEWDDPGTWDDGGVWDSSATVEDLGYFRRQIRVRKSPISLPVTIAVVLAGDGLWVSPGTWDDGGLWDDPETVVTFWPLFHCWEENAWTGEPDALWADDDTEPWEDDFV